MPVQDDSLPELISSALVWVSRGLKLAHMPGVVRAVRSRASRSLFSRMHTSVIHTMREYAIYSKGLSPNVEPHIGGLARDTVTAFRDLMGDLLEIPDSELHCCFKVIVVGDSGVDRVVTLARSIPQDHHHDDNKLSDEHLVSNNSVWAAIMGKYDGKTRWSRPYSCFACSDLLEYQDLFQCSREKWKKYYRSTLVFPLRYLLDPAKNKFKTIGFIAFYSLRKDAFPGLPNIFGYSDNWDGYQSALSENTAFQLGACLSDTLSTFLRPSYERDSMLTEQGANNV